MKVAGFLTGRVGDAVMCSVAARQFKLENPDAHLTFCIGKQFGNIIDLFKGLPYVDDVHVWDSTDDWPVPSDIQWAKENGYTMVFNGLPKHTKFDWYNHLHYVEETCLMLGLGKPADLRCELGYKPKLLPGLEKTITTSLFASGNQLYKTLNNKKIEELFKELNNLGYRVMQVGSTDPYIPGGINCSTDIFGAIDLIYSSKLHITIDTAFSWISSCYERPLIGMYGINYPDMQPGRQVSHHPVNKNARYIDAKVVDDIEISTIISHVQALI